MVSGIGLPIIQNQNMNIVDTVNAVQQKKDDEVAVLISKYSKNKDRASAPLIGGVFGFIQGLAFGALYACSKKFPSLPKKFPLLNWGINKVERFTSKFKFIKNIKNPIVKGIAAFGINTSWMIATGAVTGYFMNLYKTYKNTKVNGEISHTKKGDSADDWLLSGLNSLSYSKEGKQAIKNSIKVNSDESVTVTLKGANKEYNISKQELNDASNSYIAKLDDKGAVHGYTKKYSKGDGDVLAFELAFGKYRADLKEGKINHNPQLPSYAEDSAKNSSDSLDMGVANQAYYLLTGKEGCQIDNGSDSSKKNSKKDSEVLNLYSKAYLSKFLQEYSTNPQGYAAGFNIKSESNQDVVVRNNLKEKVKLHADHVYAIKNMSAKNVAIVDPNQSSKIIVLPIKTFKNNINALWYVNLQEQNNNEELALKKYSDESGRN